MLVFISLYIYVCVYLFLFIIVTTSNYNARVDVNRISTLKGRLDDLLMNANPKKNYPTQRFESLNFQRYAERTAVKLEE